MADMEKKFANLSVVSTSTDDSTISSASAGDFLMAEKPAPPRNDDRGTIDLVTNAYTMKLSDRSVHPYTVDIYMRFQGEAGHRDIPLVKENSMNDDYMLVASKDKCRMVMKAFADKYPDRFEKGGKIFYDLQRLMYTTEQLFVEPVLELNLTRDDFDQLGDNDFSAFGVKLLLLFLRPHSTPLFLKDFTFLTRELVEITLRHDLPQFLEIGSSQQAYLYPDKRVTYHGGVSYERKVDATKRPGCKQLWNGVQKSVKFFEPSPNNPEEPVAALVLDAKKSMFHMGKVNLIDKVYEMNLMNEEGVVLPHNIPVLARQLKKLFVRTLHLERVRALRIVDILPESCATKTFTRIIDDKEVVTTIEQYFFDRYHRQLDYPKSPVVAARGKKKEMIFYPMEMLQVCENQRVTTGQTNPQEISEMIRASAILPTDRMAEIDRQAKILEIHSRECNLGLVNVTTNPDLMTVKGRTLKPPVVTYSGDYTTTPDEQGKWRTAKTRYIIPVRMEKWAAFLFSDRPSERDIQTNQQFVDALVREAGQRGMVFSKPSVVGHVHSNNLLETFLEAADRGIQFLLFVQDSRLSRHKDIKLFERKYHIWTQDLDLKTVHNVMQKNQRITLEHILNKINVKLGGVNYKLTVRDPAVQDMFRIGRLYMGIHLNRSSVLAPNSPERVDENGSSDFMITGVSANTTDEPSAFVGDFFITEQNFAMFCDGLMAAVKRYADMYHKAAPLKEMIVYFGGVSDGDMSKLLGQVCFGIRNALEEAGVPGVKLTVMVISKAHNIRLMPQKIQGTRATEQNIKPGVVVDQGIVHHVFGEFYLNSHLTLQGTGKAGKYTVIVDDNKFDIAYLEKMSYSLAYGHQIVAMPTSMPTPSYVAKSYAERGAMLVQAYGRPDVAADANRDLSYADTPFAGVRLNA